MIYVIKKDGTREEFDSRKIITAVNKSAARILYTLSDEEKDFICRFAEEHAESLGKSEIQIQEMHNIVEGALERVNPAVAKSYDNPDTLVVARDGTGEFRTVGEAIEVCRAFMDYHKVIYVK